jgi:ethanolamine utilization protein EutN
MIIGKVTGNIVSTRKNENLVGSKFMIIEPQDGGKTFVAVDNVGAGIGETVLVTTGSSARLALHNTNAPCDAVIVGIVD